MPDQGPARQPPVALLGTGIMGAGMGRSMLRAGLAVRAWNGRRPRHAGQIWVQASTVGVAGQKTMWLAAEAGAAYRLKLVVNS